MQDKFKQYIHHYTKKELPEDTFTNPERLKEILKRRKMSDTDFFKRLVDKAVLTPKEIEEMMRDAEGLKKCKWCGKTFKDTDDFCSPECLEKYALEFLKKK